MEFNGRPAYGHHEITPQFSPQDDQDLLDFATLGAIDGDGYDYGAGFQLSPSEYQSVVPTTVTSNVDLIDVQSFVRPNIEGPWMYGQSRAQQQIPSFTVTDTSKRPFTIAGDGRAEYSPTHRPGLLQRLSQDSGLDSGFSDGQSISEAPEFVSPLFPSEDTLNASYGKLPPPPPSVRSARTAPAGKKRKGAKNIEIHCLKPNCTKVSKNRSDADKHSRQHLKQYKCNELGCRRINGFGTPNDLERHRKSVHNRCPTVGKNNAYICRACPRERELKRWPRLDNFKAHIKRKHEGVDAEALIKNSEVTWIESESGYGGSQDMDGHEYDELVNSISPRMSRHPSYASQAFVQDSSDSLAGIGAGQVSGLNSPLYSGHPVFRRNGGSVHGNLLLQDRSLDQKTMLAMEPFGSSTQNSPTGYSIFAQEQSLPDDLDLVGLRPEQRLDENNQKIIICPYPECGKPQNRLSEYRKHLKRHTRPYGCTFTGCLMKLGSRNDWKRHESSQHKLKEGWFCRTCRQLFDNQKTFTLHLQHFHNLNISQLPDACRSAHLGPEGHYNFWCGFCNDLIPQPNPTPPPDGPSMNPWEFRCKHIGDHYDKNDRLIDSWVRIDNISAPSAMLTMVSRPKQSPQTSVSPARADFLFPSKNGNISRWLAPPPPTSPGMARMITTNTNTPSRVMTVGDNHEQEDVSVFFPHDNGPIVRQSNAVDSFKDFADFDDLRDAEFEDDGGF